MRSHVESLPRWPTGLESSLSSVQVSLEDLLGFELNRAVPRFACTERILRYIRCTSPGVRCFGVSCLRTRVHLPQLHLTTAFAIHWLYAIYLIGDRNGAFHRLRAKKAHKNHRARRQSPAQYDLLDTAC